MRPEPSAPPGYYPDAEGALRWWDGHKWVDIPRDPDRTWAIVSHLGLGFFFFLLPLGILTTYGRWDDFVRRHATDAANGQITFCIVWLLFGYPGVVLSRSTGNEALRWLVLGNLLDVVWLVTMSVIGGIRASRGQTFRYPGSLPLVRTHDTVTPD